MARIPLGAVTTLNLATQVDPQTADLYDLRENVETPGYSATNKWLIMAATFLAVRHATVAKWALQIGGTERGFLQYTEAAAMLRLDSDGSIEIAPNNTTAVTYDALGNVFTVLKTAAPTITTNNTLAVHLVSNTQLRFSVRGSDGVTRTNTLTLA